MMKRVLIVDDEEDIGLLLRTMLRSAGCSAIWASSLSTARKLLASQDFQVVLLDLHLGDGHGFNLLNDIEKYQTAPDIVVITAHDEPEVRHRVQSKGIRHFIAKPFKRDQILRLVA